MELLEPPVLWASEFVTEKLKNQFIKFFSSPLNPNSQPLTAFPWSNHRIHNNHFRFPPGTMGPAQLVLPLGLPLPVVGEAFAAAVVVVEMGQLADSLDFAHVNLTSKNVQLFSFFVKMFFSLSHLLEVAAAQGPLIASELAVAVELVCWPVQLFGFVPQGQNDNGRRMGPKREILPINL